MVNAGSGRPIALTRMAMEVGKELSWQDMPLCQLGH
jgi:hypothetical protein